jgi:hypothetical protein
MKCFLFILLSFFTQEILAQNISGKWYGKITQSPGGYSQLYDLELNLTQKKNIWGDSNAWMDKVVRIRIGFSGKMIGDSVKLYESLGWIREDLVPWDWVACIKTYELVYRNDGAYEYLEGTWKGISKDDPNEDCIPGKVILSRSIEGLNKFLELPKDSVVNVLAQNPEQAPPVLIDFNKSFLETEPKKITEIDVHNVNLQIQLLDYMKPDKDTVSVYLNREILVKNIQISKRPALIKFQIDKRIVLNELLLYAENLGLVPPNTSELILIDGETRHRVMIVSDKQKTAAIYLRYKATENNRKPGK